MGVFMKNLLNKKNNLIYKKKLKIIYIYFSLVLSCAQYLPSIFTIHILID